MKYFPHLKPLSAEMKGVLNLESYSLDSFEVIQTRDTSKPHTFRTETPDTHPAGAVLRWSPGWRRRYSARLMIPLSPNTSSVPFPNEHESSTIYAPSSLLVVSAVKVAMAPAELPDRPFEDRAESGVVGGHVPSIAKYDCWFPPCPLFYLDRVLPTGLFLLSVSSPAFVCQPLDIVL